MEDRANNIWTLSTDNGEERQVTALTGRRGRLSPWVLATDGRYLYFGWEESRGDIWVADLVQPRK